MAAGGQADLQEHLEWCHIAHFSGSELNPGYDSALYSKIWKPHMEAPGTHLEILQLQICSVYGTSLELT